VSDFIEALPDQMADGCPVDGIEVSADPARIQEPCILCLNCVKICPTCAIETDWSLFVPIVPEQYAKYKKALNDAEVRGEFRWINYEDPPYKQRLRELDL
jgi:uncharacterized Fe-S center protein